MHVNVAFYVHHKNERKKDFLDVETAENYAAKQMRKNNNK